MDITNILDSLVQTVDENSIPYLCGKTEYRKEQHCAEQHTQWLQEHLNEEERAHLEQLRSAELCISTMECEALVRTALAVGIRLALSC